MREVLYRGKRVDNGEWGYGYYYKIPAPPVCFKEDKKVVQDKHFIILEHPNYVPDWGMPRKMVQVEVDPETVGQFTSTPDKNGKKIFEGDICGCFCNTQVFIVEYCKDRCGYFFDDCIKSGGCDPAPECLGNLRDTIEVIGNIYDNPDLLEGISE